MSCVTKNIDEFCNKFLSLNLNFGMESELTIEVESLGDTEIPINSEELQRYIPGTSKFELLQRTIKKSSSGVTTNCRYGDPIARRFKNVTVGTIQTGGDYLIGSEYFTIPGVPTYHGNVRNFTVSANNYKSYWYPKLDKKQGRYNKFLNSSGFLENIPDDDDKNNLNVPGYPDPYVEFGQWLYTWRDFSNLTNFTYFDHTSGNLYSGDFYRGAAWPQGLYSDSGTFQSVANGLLSGTNKIMIGSSLLGGFTVIDASQSLGQIGVLDDVGITIPNEAQSSSVSKSWADSYSSGAQVVTSTTGRLPDIKQQQMGAMVNEDGDLSDTVKEPQDREETSGSSYTLTAYNAFGDLTDADRQTYIWLNIKNSGLVKEYGTALLISEEGTEVSNVNFIENAYGKSWTSDGRKVYYNAEAAMNSSDPVEKVRTTLFSEVEANINESLFSSKVSNYNRFYQVSSPAAGKQWSARGATEDEQDLIGFDNFGPSDKPRGNKNFRSPSGGNINFYDYDMALTNSPFSELKLSDNASEIGNLRNLFQGDGASGAGVVLVDFGAVIEPTFSGAQKSFNKHETIFDFTTSNFNSDETILGGVASVNPSKLLAMVDEVIGEYADIYDSMKDQNPTQPESISSYGSELYDKESEMIKHGDEDDANASGYWGSRKIFRKGPTITGCRSSQDVMNRSDSFSSVQYTTEVTNYNERETLWSGGDQAGAEKAFYMVNRTCQNQVYVPYIEKRTFTLINQLYDFNSRPDHMRYLESASINVNNGKLTANYTFSQKMYIPNYSKVAEGIASVKNLLK